MPKGMIKQILGRLPKKPSKSAETLDSLSSTTLAGSRSNDSAPHISENGKDLSHPPSNSSLVHGNKSNHVEDLKANDNLIANEPLPSFRDAPSSEKISLFIRKVQLCCYIFDFSDPLKHLKEKEIKRQTLLELVDYLSSAPGKLPDNALEEVIKMVSINVFRAPHAQPREGKVMEAYDVDGDEPLMDPAWPHLQIVYEFFLRFLASPETDTKRSERFIDNRFILKFLDLFDSEDPREREYLKTILHRIYGKFMVHRQFVRKTINNIFYCFIYETEKFNGIAELLEVLGSIINGFALPLKEEHNFFLVCILIPLYKPKCLAIYHQQLSYCISQFVEKDSKLSDTVIRGLLKYWPMTNSSKEVIFLSELEVILEATQMPEFQQFMVPLFHRITRCLSSSHFQVAERALHLWSNDHVENLIRQNQKVILPIIFSALEKNCSSHWNQAVRSLTVNVQKLFSDNDRALFQECLRKFEEDEAKEQEVKDKQVATWKRSEDIISSKTSNSELSLQLATQHEKVQT